MTVLFADLVGFTEPRRAARPRGRARACSRPTTPRLRAELERFGGTVEKFIGDAVMALFGAPVAHEDDPERAVRAALAIRDAIAELQRGATASSCTCASASTPARRSSRSARDPSRGRGHGRRRRRQHGRAPAGGRAGRRRSSSASRPTARRADAIEYRAGRAGRRPRARREPVPVWEALEPRSRLGRRRRRARRRRRWSAATEELEPAAATRSAACARERAPQLVTLVGVPGHRQEPARRASSLPRSTRTRS